MSKLIKQIYSIIKKENKLTNSNSVNFDEGTLDDKIVICERIIEKSNFSTKGKEDLKQYLHRTSNAENPKKFYSEFECFNEEEIPNQIVHMFDKIYAEVIPTKGKARATESFRQAFNDLKYLTKKDLENPNIHHIIRDVIFTIEEAFEYLIDSKLESSEVLYKQIGDLFFSTAIGLKDLGEKNESQLNLNYAMLYYKKGNISVPLDLQENWDKYMSNETDELRIDWQIEQENILSVISKYIQ